MKKTTNVKPVYFLTKPIFSEGAFMKIDIYQVDAFTDKLFGGNPAAVCPLTYWPNDNFLQSIASENNLSETAFFVKEEGNCYKLRWFTPVREIALCGHATLATAHVIFNYIDKENDVLNFQTLSGLLTVKKDINELLSMDFPAYSFTICDCPSALKEAFHIAPTHVYKGEDYMAVFKTPQDILSLNPNMEYFKKLDLRGVVVTATGNDVDFVSRFFAPKYGIDEDPVTGSAHCMLAPYWSKVLGKNELKGIQLSKRGGEIFCKINGNRVTLSGRSVIYLRGNIELPVD